MGSGNPRLRQEAANAIQQKANAELAGGIATAERQFNAMVNDFQDRQDYENFAGEFEERTAAILATTTPRFRTREGLQRFQNWLVSRETERLERDPIRALIAHESDTI